MRILESVQGANQVIDHTSDMLKVLKRSLSYQRVELSWMLIVATCILTLVGCQQSIPSFDTWQEYKLGGDQLGVKFPFKPEFTTQKQSTAIGPLKLEIHNLEVNRSNVFVSSFTKLPAVPSYDVAAGLDGAVQQSAKSSNSKVVSSTNISKNGIQGKESYLKNEKGLMMRNRTYISGNLDGPKLYQVMVVARNKSTLDNETSTAFLDSANF